jgi:hypothetical protein
MSEADVRPAEPSQVHQYLSTSCLHADADGRPELHVYCRSRVGSNGETEWAKEPSSCKFCGARCICECHVTQVSREVLMHLARDWAAQAAQEERRLGFSKIPLSRQKAEILRACASQLSTALGPRELRDVAIISGGPVLDPPWPQSGEPGPAAGSTDEPGPAAGSTDDEPEREEERDDNDRR